MESILRHMIATVFCLERTKECLCLKRNNWVGILIIGPDHFSRYVFGSESVDVAGLLFKNLSSADLSDFVCPPPFLLPCI